MKTASARGTRVAEALEAGEAKPPGAQALDLVEFLLSVVEAGEHRLGVGDQRPAGVGEPGRSGTALEQPDSDLALERGDLLADGWLGVVERLGGRGDRSPRCDLCQRAQPAQI